MQRIHMVVKGRVQGVGFRYFIHDAAAKMDVTGFVRNLPDGSVEIVAEGTAEWLSRLQSAAKQGPSFSHVTDIVLSFPDATGEFSTFEILR